MKTIYKYPIECHTDEIPMPQGAQILCVQMQSEQPCIWALVDPSRPMAPRKIHIYGTGFNMPDNPGLYLGTFQNGPFVWHVFQE